jgi:uncharacterized membrane protein
MKRLIHYFMNGVLFLGPIAATVWVLLATFRVIDGWLRLPVRGAGVLVLILVILGTGFLMSHYFTARILGWFELTLDRLPFFRLLHSSVKDMVGAFVGDKKKFDKPVAVELVPGSGIHALGFLVREDAVPELKGHVAVYLPQSYNFAGQLLVVPRERITLLALDSAPAMTFIVSGGVSGLDGHEQVKALSEGG